jgi:hypothetical protein
VSRIDKKFATACPQGKFAAEICFSSVARGSNFGALEFADRPKLFAEIIAVFSSCIVIV